ncbi:hypothetical protein CBJ61_21955 [Salmonella enterica subsp. enterica serovar Ajiobo]|nr:hypothetical protein [Salmonella enterica subsp. enterica serovar Ajiobo]
MIEYIDNLSFAALQTEFIARFAPDAGLKQQYPRLYVVVFCAFLQVSSGRLCLRGLCPGQCCYPQAYPEDMQPFCG